MREILFRGKRTGNGEWVTGTPFFYADRCKMIQAVAVHPDFIDEGNVYYSEGFPVDPETVGQFTGLTDKNGKKIFEGDILEFNSRIVNIASGLPTGGNCTERSVVEWGGHRWNRKRIYHSQWNSNWRNYGFTTDLYPENAAKYAEIIGNIHDNPEFLEVPHE